MRWGCLPNLWNNALRDIRLLTEKVYRYGLLDLKERIAGELANLDFMNDPEATDKQEELTAMSISCDAAILFAERHADLADEMSMAEKRPGAGCRTS